MQRSRPATWPWLLLAFLIVFGVGGVGLALVTAAVGGGGTLGPHVGLIDLSGEISDQSSRSLTGGSTFGARDFIAAVEAAQKDETIKAVVIRINSPGGSAAASQEMYQAVRRLEAKKPVVCSMGDLAASGGYYVATACDKIYANGSTLTGSIGVISEFMNFQSLFQRFGVTQEVIKSGKFKDIGNYSRAMTPDERKIFQAMNLGIYNQFVDDVVAGRSKAPNGKLTKAQVLKLADGRVYTGLQAKANHLIDAIGGLYDASHDAAKMGGVGEDPKLREVGGGSLLGSLMSASAQSVTPLAQKAGASFAAGYLHELKAEANQPAQVQAR